MVAAPTRPGRRSRPGAGLGAVVSAVVFGVAVLWVVGLHATLWWIDERPEPKEPWGDEVQYLAEARAWTSGSGPEPNLLWPPLHGRFLGAVEGAGVAVGLAPRSGVRIAQTCLLLLAAVLGAAIARALGARPWAAAGVAFLFLGYPPLAAYAHYLWPEILHLVLFLVAVWILLRHRNATPFMPVLGLILGLALLTKSLLLPCLPLLLAPVAAQGPWRRRWLRLALVLATVALTLTPTLIRNHRATGQWVVADSSAFNIWLGLNDRGLKSFEEPVVDTVYRRWQQSAPTFAERNAKLRRRTRELVREAGPRTLLRAQLRRQYFRLFDKDSFLTDQLPGGDIHARGGGYQDTPRTLVRILRGASFSLYAWLLVAAAFGLVWLVVPELVPTALSNGLGKGPPGSSDQEPRLPALRGGRALGLALTPRQRSWMVACAAFLAYNLAIFLVLHVKSRYRIQFLPVLFLFATLATQGVVLRLRGQLEDSPKGPLWLVAVATAAAACLLFLAFAGPWLGSLSEGP